MTDLPRPRATTELPLTRNHLYALGALSLALAVLSFFVGLSVGRGRAVAPVAPPAAQLLSEEARTGDLEVLLAGVEHASTPEATLSFPAELPRSDPPPPPPPDPTAAPDPNAPVAPVGDAVAAPAAPPPEDHAGAGAIAPGNAVVPALGADVPRGGWAIQVAQHADEHDADRYVATLKAAELPAYKVVALVDGKTVWRVRIGGYASKDGATAALAGVASKAGASGATVTPAP